MSTKDTVAAAAVHHSGGVALPGLHHYELTGLEPFTLYEVWVRAIVDGKETANSRHLFAKTDVDQPSAPFVTNASCFDTGKLAVQWRRPLRYQRAVDSYMLYFRKVDDVRYDFQRVQPAAATEGAGDSELQRVSFSIEI